MINLHLSRRIQHAITGLILLLLSYIIPSYPLGFILLTVATITFYYIHYKRIYDIEWDNWYITKFGMLLREHELGEWEEDEDDNYNNGDTDDSASLSKSKHITKKDTTTSKKMRRSRRKTIPSLPGAFYFLLGTTISTYTFSISIARTSLLVLSLADPIAGIVGVFTTQYIGLNISWKMLFQKIVRGNGERSGGGGGGPTVAGSVACGITTILCTYVYIPSSVDNQSTISSSASASNHDNSISLSFNARLWIGIITAIIEAISGRYLPVIGIRIADDNLWIPLVVGSLILLLNQD